MAAWCARAEAGGGGPFRKGPFLQSVTPTAVTVVWESSEELPGRVHLLGRDGAIQASFDAPSGEIHEVVIDHLEPGRRYRYRVECAGKSEDGELATAPESGAPFSFVVFGDSRDNIASHQRVVERVRHEVPAFILGTGDMVNDGAKEEEWQAFFEVERAMLRENVMYPSVGNHDRQGRGRSADNYRRYFSLPENSPDPERYYAFTYSNARFLILDSNSYSFSLTDQTAWIERELQAARLQKGIDHIFVSMHHPPFSISLHGGQRELRERWTPLYEKYGVTAVFSGHDHVYSRAEKNGVRYFVSGGGGAPLYPRSPRASELDLSATKFFERVNHYVRVQVYGQFVEISAFRADGTLIETVAWGEAPRPLTLAAAAGAGADAEDTVLTPASPALGSPSRGGGGFGWFGWFGAALVLVAAAVLVRALRAPAA